ncbi:hypothetical protein [Exiguobacterium mexicanum]|uniref:hypothetical protein n=1 Tax=Exiguobacterium mexicanum TaxID=340146 RepID=UPI0037C08858
MKKVSFNMIRSAGIKTDYAKPEYYYDQLDKVRAADLVLFPEYWMVNSIIYGLNKPISRPRRRTTSGTIKSR